MTGALGIDAAQAAGVLAAFCLGGLMKGTFGFGLPLVTISTLPLIVPIDLALALNALILPPTNLWQFLRAGRPGETVRRFWPLILGLCIAMPFGATLVASVPAPELTIALGIAIMAFSAFNWLSPRIAIPAAREKPVGAAIGVAAGVVGGITTVNGPFFIMYLVGIGADRRLMLSALGLFFLITGAVLSGAFVAFGVLDGPRALFGLGCLVPVAAGMWLGDRAARRLSVGAYRTLVLVALFCLGANLAIRTAFG